MYSDNRTYQDVKNWNPLVNKVFFERNPRDEREIRTYTMRWNPMAERISPMISNWHVAEPTPDMKPFHPSILSAVNRFQSNHY